MAALERERTANTEDFRKLARIMARVQDKLDEALRLLGVARLKSIQDAERGAEASVQAAALEAKVRKLEGDMTALEQQLSGDDHARVFQLFAPRMAKMQAGLDEAREQLQIAQQTEVISLERGFEGSKAEASDGSR
ncbi:hypothetical protein LTR65_005865 [Meristemomyces frigidus]